MNILIDVLPESVEIDGQMYEINSDFRTSILFELLMGDESISDEYKQVQALELYYPVVPNNIILAIDKIVWFYGCGKEENKSNVKHSKTSSKYNKIYSFEYDDDYIYSAFLDQYNIDLQDIEYLHWWKFKAMFKSLKEDNEIVKIMKYRATDLSAISDKEERAFYKKMKDLYKIPSEYEKADEEKIDRIEKILMGDGVINNM